MTKVKVSTNFDLGILHQIRPAAQPLALGEGLVCSHQLLELVLPNAINSYA